MFEEDNKNNHTICTTLDYIPTTDLHVLWTHHLGILILHVYHLGLIGVQYIHVLQ